MTLNFDQFLAVDIRCGTVVKAERFEEARKPAFKVWVDFGAELGTLQTSAQITHHYTPAGLIGRQVAGCVNLGEKRIAGFKSQFLLLGFSDADGNVSLIKPEPAAPNGTKLH